MWRLRLVPLAAVMVLLFAGCDWAQYAFDSANTGHDLNATAFTTSSVTSLHQVWSVPGPTASPARLAVVGDTAYVAGSDTVEYSITGCLPLCPPPPPNGPVSALRITDGALRWVVAGPRLEGGCYAATESMGAPTIVARKVLFLRSGQPFCVEGSSGYAKASAKSIDAVTGAVGDPPNGYGLPDGDAVVTSDGGIYLSDDHLESFAGELHPTDATVVGPAGFAFTPDPSVAHQTGFGYRMGTPAVDAQHVYAVGVGGSLGTSQILFAIDRATATESWRAVLPAGADASALSVPSIGNGRVIVSVGTKVLAFDADGGGPCTTSSGTTTCSPLWSASMTDAATVQAPAISRHRVFVRSGTTLRAYRTDDGSLLWSAPLGAASGTTTGLGPPSVAAGVAFVGTQDGRLLAFDATGVAGCSATPKVCAPLWSAALSGPTGPSRPVIAGKAVYISSSNGSVSKVTKFAF